MSDIKQLKESVFRHNPNKNRNNYISEGHSNLGMIPLSVNNQQAAQKQVEKWIQNAPDYDDMKKFRGAKIGGKFDSIDDASDWLDRKVSSKYVYIFQIGNKFFADGWFRV